MEFKLSKKKLPITGPAIQGKLGKTEVVILGTAHVSRESVEDVENLLAKMKPELVAVELCESRFQAFMDRDSWKKLNIVQVIREKKLFLLFSTIVLSIFQKKMGEHTQTKPGEEMMRAVEIAHEKDHEVVLADRNIRTTLRRAWQSLNFFSRITVLSEMIGSLFFQGEIDKEEIEKMKKRDVLEDLIENLPPQFSAIRNILIHERDVYLAQKIRNAVAENPEAKKLVAVVGAGHLPGIEENLNIDNDIAPLDEVKGKNPWLHYLGIFLPIVIVIGLILYFSGTDPLSIADNLLLWVIVKVVASVIFPIILLAHPLAILGAALAGPVSNFNPVFKPGWIAALAEAYFRKPLVEDFENLVHDTRTVRGFLKNRVMRVFMIFFLSQLGATIGTFVALALMAGK